MLTKINYCIFNNGGGGVCDDDDTSVHGNLCMMAMVVVQEQDQDQEVEVQIVSGVVEVMAVLQVEVEALLQEVELVAVLGVESGGPQVAQGVNFHLDGAEVQEVLVEAPWIQTQEVLLEGGEGDPRLLAEEEEEVAVVMDQGVEVVLVLVAGVDQGVEAVLVLVAGLDLEVESRQAQRWSSTAPPRSGGRRPALSLLIQEHHIGSLTFKRPIFVQI